MIAYRVIVKVYCSDCSTKIVFDCPRCTFLKYRTVNNLLSLKSYLDKNYPSWAWMKVYEKSKNDTDGAFLKTFKNGVDVPLRRTL